MSVHGPRDVCHESMEYSTEHMHQGPPTIALKGLVHNPDKIGRSKVPRADFIRTKWPKIGGRGGRKIRTYGPRVSDV